MSEHKLTLEKREIIGKKVKALRAKGMIPSVVYGGKEPQMMASDYVATEKVLDAVGYHSPLDLDMAGKKQMAIVKNVAVDPVSRKIINVEFQAISAKEEVEATTPIEIVEFEASEASKVYHFALTQSIEEIEIKAKPADLPENLTIDASGLKDVEDKITIADIKLPNGVKFADKELDMEQVVASLYDPAVEAEKREAESITEPIEEESEGEAATEESAEKEPSAEA
ncbi:50S ribosomal protein L25 [Candidatus Saccharibacteria bacterium]|nr:50S ribosomal protein L25 [Candidatus Saccharibacteria bacterium]